jgi:ABC-type phosphate transport system auxiliary subunit
VTLKGLLAGLNDELDKLSKLEAKTPEEEKYRTERLTESKAKKTALETKVTFCQQVLDSLKKSIEKASVLLKA